MSGVEKDGGAAPYETSADAYRAIHRSIAYWIEGSLLGCTGEDTFAEAMRLAGLMGSIEDTLVMRGDAP